MMNQEEVDELIDDSDGSEADPKGKGRAVQTASRTPKLVPQSVPASPPVPPGNRSLNINRNKTTSHPDQQHGRSSVQTTLTSPNTTRDPQTHSSRKRTHSNTNDTPNITSMLTSQVSRSNRPLYDTRNQTMVVDCDFDSIKQDYEANAEHRARYRNMKINDYLVLNRSDQSDPLQYVTNLIKHPELSEKGLAFYTRGILHDQRIYELGVLKVDE
jgi:hypothetical protein